jgi:hypothetical protein
MFHFYSRGLFKTFFHKCKLQYENVRVLAPYSDSFSFRYSAFRTACRVDLVEFAWPTAWFEGACGLILQLLNGSDTCFSFSVSTHLVRAYLQKMYGVKLSLFRK